MCAFMRVTGRDDDMMIIRGVNVFPSQLEAVLVGFPGLAPHYQIVLTRQGALDDITIEVESASDAADTPGESRGAKAAAVKHHIKSMIGVTCNVVVKEPGEVPRSQGKAVRVRDEARFRPVSGALSGNEGGSAHPANRSAAVDEQHDQLVHGDNVGAQQSWQLDPQQRSGFFPMGLAQRVGAIAERQQHAVFTGVARAHRSAGVLQQPRLMIEMIAHELFQPCQEEFNWTGSQRMVWTATIRPSPRDRNR